MIRFVSKVNNIIKLKRNYHKRVIDHYENPRNVGSLDKNDTHVGRRRPGPTGL